MVSCPYFLLSSGVAAWRLVGDRRLCPGACRSASPGKLGEFEEELFRSAEMSETPVVMAVTVALVEGARMVRRLCAASVLQQRLPKV